MPCDGVRRPSAVGIHAPSSGSTDWVLERFEAVLMDINEVLDGRGPQFTVLTLQSAGPPSGTGRRSTVYSKLDGSPIAEASAVKVRQTS